MTLVNETGVPVTYWVGSADGLTGTGQLDVDGIVELSDFDNRQTVEVKFWPAEGNGFTTIWASTQTDEQTEMALVADAGSDS
ncbi:MAG TPA: hypothetical protein VNZ44_12180 [Pyrinomonadaceae bacterium]|nr:hypothetical protein [Pyrinomonadaceae bacterium]